jgi:hypothetical protein
MPILSLPNIFMAGLSSPRPDRISRVSGAELGTPPRHVLLELGPHRLGERRLLVLSPASKQAGVSDHTNRSVGMDDSEESAPGFPWHLLR